MPPSPSAVTTPYKLLMSFLIFGLQHHYLKAPEMWQQMHCSEITGRHFFHSGATGRKATNQDTSSTSVSSISRYHLDLQELLLCLTLQYV